MSDPKQLYELNRRTIETRFSREYLVGSRVLLYLDMLKHGKLGKLVQRFRKDRKTMRLRKQGASVPEKTLSIDFSIPYSGERMAVYTSIYGKYDSLCEPIYVDPNCDYFILTNQDVPPNSLWKKIDFEFPEEINTDFLKNRYVKMFPHKVFPDYRYSLYVDGNITLVSAVSLYLKDFDCKSGIAMHKHPASNDLFDEIEACLMTNKITESESKELKQKLEKEGFPKNYGMFECNIILRDHKSEACMRIMEKWWDELLKGAKRDQLHFTYALFKMGYKYSDLALLGLNMNMNPMFIREAHI